MVKSVSTLIIGDTEGKILTAAKNVFLRKGMDGARMQEIADEANINKAMLHYYFRTKEKLFFAIFAEAFQSFFPKIQETLLKDIPLTEKIKIFIDKYIDLLIENPYLPGFILGEINRNPQTIISVFLDNWFSPTHLISQIKKEMEDKKIRTMDPRHLLINIVSMCIFPFIGKPFITAMLFENDDEKFKSFIQERKAEVSSFVLASLEIDQ
jgi:TetR/AcrR family transcriptional regulator